MSGDNVPGKHWLADGQLHIDTRGLEPPDPMVAIVWHLSQPGQEGPVTAYFDRDPVHLFPELAERGWRYEYAEREPDRVQLILRRGP